MNTAEALKAWGYQPSRQNKAKLKEICAKHPELCRKQETFDILETAQKPYLPDKRRKDPYTNIALAVRTCSHLYPETIAITEAHLAQYLQNMLQAGLISRLRSRALLNTQDYAANLTMEEWLNQKTEKRIKHILDVIEKVKPDININIGVNIS